MNPFNSTTKVRGLPSTSSTVAWTIPAWNPGDTVASPDIAAVLNDIVGRADWTSCNDIVLIVEGTGDREASSHNSNPGQAPQLRIQLNNNPPLPGALGDVDCDSILTANDADLIAAYSVGNVIDSGGCPAAPGTLNLSVADTNGSGHVSAADALLVSQCAAGNANDLCPDDIAFPVEDCVAECFFVDPTCLTQCISYGRASDVPAFAGAMRGFGFAMQSLVYAMPAIGTCPMSETVFSDGPNCFTVISAPPGQPCPISTTPQPFGPDCRRPVDMRVGGANPNAIPNAAVNACQFGPAASAEYGCGGFDLWVTTSGLPYVVVGTDHYLATIYWIGPANLAEMCSIGVDNCDWDWSEGWSRAIQVALIAAGFFPYTGEIVDTGFCAFDTYMSLAGDGSWVSTGLSCGALAAPFVPAALVRVGGQTSVIATRLGDDVIDHIPSGLRRACNSFSATTDVLLANGDHKAISDIEIVNLVWATDPETGETGPRQVTATWPHEDTLVDLVTSSGSITTTEDHHFWNVTDQAWQESQHLDTGDRLLAADGTIVTVEGLDWTTSHYSTAYDLTIDDLHTFFVTAGDTEVLVHNCNGGLGQLVPVNVTDPAADALASRLNGQASLRFENDITHREFDVVSALYVAQTKPAGLQLGSQFRNQAKATYEAAIISGRTPYFHFAGPPTAEVLAKLSEYDSRYGIQAIVDVSPLN